MTDVGASDQQTYSEDSLTGLPVPDKSSDGAAHVSGLATNGVTLAAATTYNSTDVLGYKITAQGTADWSITLKNGSALTVPFASMVVGDVLPEHLSSITSGAGGTAILYIPS